MVILEKDKSLNCSYSVLLNPVGFSNVQGLLSHSLGGGGGGFTRKMLKITIRFRDKIFVAE